MENDKCCVFIGQDEDYIKQCEDCKGPNQRERWDDISNCENCEINRLTQTLERENDSKNNYQKIIDELIKLKEQDRIKKIIKIKDLMKYQQMRIDNLEIKILVEKKKLKFKTITNENAELKNEITKLKIENKNLKLQLTYLEFQ